MGFVSKILVCLPGKNLKFFIIAKSGIVALECVLNSIISWNISSALVMSFLGRKLKNIQRLRKIGECDEKRVFLQKKVFIFLKALFTEI